MERRPIQRRKKRENAIILPRRDDFLEDDMEEESKEMEEKNELVTIPTQKASKSLTDLITGSEEIDERKLAERPEFGFNSLEDFLSGDEKNRPGTSEGRRTVKNQGFLRKNRKAHAIIIKKKDFENVVDTKGLSSGKFDDEKDP
eukprot:TRINITY_DN7915_c0_g1_i3.p1 TRINITY_DN7915_c0_g1~~TRINITY_DN7915_c0_g1_i3.p1  ORF type:complete len:144 (-),score=42.18 TRINITY_DN7915_c0_g1_i3:99-530(-)